MARRFVKAPGWPTPPPGWYPDRDWLPDSSWETPEGWKWNRLARRTLVFRCVVTVVLLSPLLAYVALGIHQHFYEQEMNRVMHKYAVMASQCGDPQGPACREVVAQCYEDPFWDKISPEPESMWLQDGHSAASGSCEILDLRDPEGSAGS